MLQLDPICKNERQVIREFRLQRDAISLYFAARERDDITYGMIDVHPVFLRRSFLRKGPNAVDDFTRSSSVCPDQFGRLPRLLDVTGGEPAQTGVNTIHNRAERLIDFMRDRGRHLSQGRHSCHMREFRLRTKQCFFRTLAFDKLTYLASDCSQRRKQLLIGLPDLAAEKLDDAQHFAAEQDRKTKRCVQSFPCGNRRSLEVGFSH